jgi:dihydroorotate dehydrogenase (NAD+) catalytic subunit
VAVSPGVTGLELNLAWPPESRVSADAHQVGRIVAAVCRELPAGIPVLAKVASEPSTVVEVGAAAARAGAAAVVVGHGLPGLALDPQTLRPRAGHDRSALTGPAVHPVALRCLWEVHRALPDVPLVGCGGVTTGRDALAMLAAGARAVQVGSALLHDPCAAHRVLEELTTDLAARDLTGLADIVGAAHHLEGDPR